MLAIFAWCKIPEAVEFLAFGTSYLRTGASKKSETLV